MPRPVRFFLLLSALCLAACASVQANEPADVTKLIREVASTSGKSPAQLRALLDDAQRKQSIIDTMRRPAESLDWPAYRKIFMTRTRIDDGIAFYRAHAALLQRVSLAYGVPASYLVSILGVETNYGRITGNYRVLDALYTLAFYYPPRAAFFRKELKTLLELPDDKLAGPLDTLKGSYAGAQGWGQFMPSSIGAYAVDGDHDGHINLTASLPDILSSVANYLHVHGWKADAPVAVQATARPDAQTVKVQHSKPLYQVATLEARGYVPVAKVGKDLLATLLRLDGAIGPRDWLTFGNFYVITRYNRSPMYALVVHQLAQAIDQGVDVAAGAHASR